MHTHSFYRLLLNFPQLQLGDARSYWSCLHPMTKIGWRIAWKSRTILLCNQNWQRWQTNLLPQGLVVLGCTHFCVIEFLPEIYSSTMYGMDWHGIFDTQQGHPIHLPRAMFTSKIIQSQETPLEIMKLGGMGAMQLSRALAQTHRNHLAKLKFVWSIQKWLWLPSPSANTISKPEALKTKSQNLNLSFLLNLCSLFLKICQAFRNLLMLMASAP